MATIVKKALLCVIFIAVGIVLGLEIRSLYLACMPVLLHQLLIQKRI